MSLPRPRSLRLATALAAVTLLVAACGDDTIDGGRATTPDSASAGSTVPDMQSQPEPTAPPAADAPDKPVVEIPAELPTELVVTDLVEGTGPAAVVGDTVVVHYVGVRSVDGTEFDNSYDRGAPYPVTIGQTQVIEGWTQGLVGAKLGARRQIDIPAELAYGDSPNGDIIQAGDALTFVVDVMAMIGAGDPADAPTDPVAPAANVEQIAIDDLVAGTGPALQPGQTAAIQIVLYRADTGEQLSSTWEGEGRPFTFVAGNNEVLPGIDMTIEGMSVGGRRQAQVPFLLAFGEEGRDDLGVPASTDVVLVIDLVGAY